MKSKNRYLQKISTRQGSWPPPHSVILTSSVGKIDMWVTPKSDSSARDKKPNIISCKERS